MSYQPLARKYRPAKFSDLIGQDSVAKALAGAINLDRLHPSIIFSGVRGIGKTTTARLLAKALCCDEGVSPEPCGICTSCVAISKGVHEDVLEIDGASNNGVDEVRSLKESVSYIPQRSKYKVYIIDEVHMLSVSAFNALLKTLEEPPPNVVFIFATTELHKVPATVVGRCLTFHLKKFTSIDLITRVKYILEQEHITYEEEALAIIAREGHGSMRDALTFLDQVIAIGDGKVTMQSIEGIVTSISSDPFIEILSAMIKRDGHAAIDIVEKLDVAGVAFRDVVLGVAEFARHGFILKGLGRDSLEKSLLGLTEMEISKLNSLAEESESLDFNRIFRVVQSCIKELDGSELDRYTFENCLLEWCFDPGLPNIEDLLSGQGFAETYGSSHQSQSNLLHENSAVSSGLKHKPKQSLMKSLMAELNKDTNEHPSSQANSASVASAEPVEEKKNSELVESQNKDVQVEKFPENWRGLVESWKRLKPIQARKLEEVHPLTYNEKEIVVAVEENGMIGKELLTLQSQQSLNQVFKELFGFKGTFRAVAISNVDPKVLEKSEYFVRVLEKDSNPSSVIKNEKPNQTEKHDQLVLPESIEQQKFKESELKREEILSFVKKHDLTTSVLTEFEAEIVDIRVINPKALYSQGTPNFS